MKERVENILEQLTLEEKAGLLSGADFWHTKSIEKLNIPRVMMCDGPNGLRKQIGEGDHLGINESIETVCYPTASALASSFDKNLLSKVGETLGVECQVENVGMLLGAGVNIKRSPLCGRNFEYFSEDPYLSGKLAAAYVLGLQEQGVSACVKHFAANNQEAFRMSGSSNVDERTLREIYFPAFEMAVKEGKTRSIMCAYNAINGEFCSENKWLLTDVLRDEWGFNGFVVTDWGAAKNPVKAVKAGLDLIMPGGSEYYKNAIIEAVNSEELTLDELDKAVINILNFVTDYQDLRNEKSTIDRTEVAKIATQVAEQCATLLKNEDLLPLDKSSKVAFIGEYAEKPRYQGSGSSHINVPVVLGAMNFVDENVRFAKGFESEIEETNDKLLNEAIEVAKNSEIAVLFVGLPDSFETEGIDRETLDMPRNQVELIEKVAEVQPNTVVVLHGGSSMSLPWLDKVKSVLLVHLGGQGVGEATVNLLYGDVNPSGKLAETWVRKLSDNSSFLNYGGLFGNVTYAEGIYVGYRYYDKKEMDVLFPFGFGLSYTDFEYSNLKISAKEIKDTELLEVSCVVKNTGSYKGQEVVQLYVKNQQNEIGRAIRELKGFEKIELEPNEEKIITFVLDKRSFAYYETELKDWFVESGLYSVEIGASSRDIKITENVIVTSTVDIPYIYSTLSPVISLLKTAKGRELMKQFTPSEEEFEKTKESSDALGVGGEKMMRRMMMEMPLGAMANFGTITNEQLEGMIQMLNS